MPLPPLEREHRGGGQGGRYRSRLRRLELTQPRRRSGLPSRGELQLGGEHHFQGSPFPGGPDLHSGC